ncbi:Acetylglutamate kinase [Buchnera aphidicola (Takecallis arundicolens)]|uniref:amino acid kinase family protein n=1 Tax=Buchnera aphidicola TaxID=9 RepID=UPI0034643D11
MKHVLVIKLGGMLLSSVFAMNNFFKTLYEYKKINQNILLVHGGEIWAKNLLSNTFSLNQENKVFHLDYNNNVNNDFKFGIFSGTINSNILKYAGLHGINAIGLHCTDGDTIIFKSSDIRDCIFYKNNSLTFINSLLKSNIMPIISPTAITKDNLLINVDSDLIAVLLAQAFQARLIMLTDVSGVLDGKGHVIRKINYLMYEQLICDGIISSGMLIKVNLAMQAAQYLKSPVNIAGCTDRIKLKKIFSGNAIGTIILNSDKERSHA